MARLILVCLGLPTHSESMIPAGMGGDLEGEAGGTSGLFLGHNRFFFVF